MMRWQFREVLFPGYTRRMGAIAGVLSIGLAGVVAAAEDGRWDEGSTIEVASYQSLIEEDDWSDAISQALADAEEGDTVHFCDQTPVRLIDREFVIDKTIRLTMDPETEVRLRGRDTDGHNAEVFKGDRTHIFQIQADNVVFDGVNLDVNSRNNYHHDDQGERIFYAFREHDHYPNGVGGITHLEKDSGEYPSGTRIINGRVTNSATSGISVRGANAEVRNMTVEKCLRDAISMTRADHATIHDNLIYNTLYHAIHVYHYSENVSIKGNRIISDGLDPSLTNAPPRRLNHSIYIGHGRRSTGTVHHVTVEDNVMLVSHNTAGISVLEDVTNVDVLNNRIVGGRLGVRLLRAGADILVEGNEISESNVEGIQIRGEDTRDAIIRNNRIESSWMEPGEEPMSMIHFSDDTISNVQVIDNQCIPGKGNSTHSIRLGANTTNCLIRGNFVPQGILDDGSDNRIEDNRQHD